MSPSTPNNLDSVIAAIEARDLLNWEAILRQTEINLDVLLELQYLPLHYCCEQGWLEGVLAYSKHPSFLLALRLFDDLSHTPLISAIRHKHDDIAFFLIHFGADVNQHQAERIGTNALLEAVEQKNWKICKHLLLAGADPNIAGWMGRTAARLILAESPQKMKQSGVKAQVEWLLKNSNQ
jgi:hypothetical protein